MVKIIIKSPDTVSVFPFKHGYFLVFLRRLEILCTPNSCNSTQTRLPKHRYARKTAKICQIVWKETRSLYLLFFNYILKLKYVCWIVPNFVFPQPLHYKNCNTNRRERTVLILIRKFLEFPVLTNQGFMLMIKCK